jgi:hypothetical protein
MTPAYTLLSHRQIEAPDAPASPATPPQIADGPERISVTDSAVLEALEAGMRILNSHSSSSVLYQAVRVVEATRQIADGIIWSIIAEMGLTDCANDRQAHSTSECPVVGTLEYKRLDIQERSWESGASRYSLTNQPLGYACAQFRCANQGCVQYAVDEHGCQDGCKCADVDNEDPNTTGLVWGAVFIVVAALVLAVMVGGFWVVRKRRNHDAILVLTEEPQMPVSPSQKAEEGQGLVVSARSQL